jgi:CRP/FNR family transcriptional regulator, cyclic AMP receptor protein
MPKAVTKIAEPSRPSKDKANIDVISSLKSTGMARKLKIYKRKDIIYCQGDSANTILYLEEGGVKLSVVSEAGKEAVVAVLGAGDFFGEGCLAGQSIRMGTATALTSCALLAIEKKDMLHILHERQEFSDLFISFMLTRNIRAEEDLINQFFYSSEKRLARTLLLLARYGKEDVAHQVLPKLSQETLAEIVGTTRPRVNFFLNKFRKLGFIKYSGGLQVNSSLLSVVLHD